jgi:hypothetical protein
MMNSQHRTFRPISLRLSALRAVAAMAFLLALASFVCAFSFHCRGLTDDPLWAIVAGLIGSISLIASAVSFQNTMARPIMIDRKNILGLRLSNGVVRGISLLLGSVASIVGADFIRMSFIVLNEEYLDWFYLSTSFNGSGSQLALLVEFVLTGIVIGCIGLFLMWYAVHPLSRFTLFVRRVSVLLRFIPQSRHPNAVPQTTNPESNT